VLHLSVIVKLWDEIGGGLFPNNFNADNE
jgi:hypothetical protein